MTKRQPFRPSDFPDYSFSEDGTATRVTPHRRGVTCGQVLQPRLYRATRDGKLYYNLFKPSVKRCVPVCLDRVRTYFGNLPLAVDHEAWYAEDTAFPRKRIHGFPWYVSDADGRVYRTHTTSGAACRVARPVKLNGKGAYQLLDADLCKHHIFPEEAAARAGWQTADSE
jgi:hypothetical protein